MKFFQTATVILTALFISVSVFASKTNVFTKENIKKVTNYLESNIATKTNVFNYKGKDYICKSIPGAMIAAPVDKTSPKLDNEYKYTWARDTAISMHTIASLYEQAITSNNKKDIQKYGHYLYNYITNWLPKTVFQNPADISMFYVDSKQAPRTFQADGPPARVRALTYMSEIFIKNPQTIKLADKTIELNKEFVVKNIFNPKTPKTDLIGYELKYISKNWNTKTVGLWEMTHGHHYYTQMLDLNALVKGAVLAKQLGYKNWTSKCLKQAYNIAVNLKSFYQEWKYYGEKHNLAEPQITIKIITELQNAEEKPIKVTDKWYEEYQRAGGLNTSVILGSLYGNIFDNLQKNSETYKLLYRYKYYKKLRANINEFNFLPYSNEMIQTAYYIRNANVAKNIEPPYSQGIDVYKINTKENLKNGFGPYIGRYPSDHYNGMSWSDINAEGNPWFITNAGLARYYYNLAYEYRVLGEVNIPDAKSNTPEVINFFRQASGIKDLKPGIYKKGSDIFNKIISGLSDSGNALMKSINKAAEKYDMHMSEQIDRNTGKEASFQNLSWSYSSFLDTYMKINRADRQ
jgi:glucoamylase